MKLGILDQSPRAAGSSSEEALQNTITLAVEAEKMGYSRFWVSEHHDSSGISGSSPEVLAAFIAARTNTIRIGSGGVMVPHYSAYKVVENFRVLGGLAPGRVDLGIGRAPGGMPKSTMALQEGRPKYSNRFTDQVDELKWFLTDTLPVNHPLHGLKASPQIGIVPEMWMLGSSAFSAELAAEKGLPYNFALFINGEGGEQYMAQYRRSFIPSIFANKPNSIVTVFAVCAETDQEANYVAASMDLTMLWLSQGILREGTPHPSEFTEQKLSPFEEARIKYNRQRMVVGSPKTVMEALKKLQDEYGADEIMLVTITHSFADKLKSFRLLAEEANLNS